MNYLIKKGKHFASLGLRVLSHKFVFGNSMQHIVTFDAMCRYVTKDASNQTDANKLFGFTEGLTLVENNSTRFGWNYNPVSGKIMLRAYIHDNGRVINKELREVEIGSGYTLEIVRLKWYVFFVVDGYSYKFDRNNSEMP